MEEQLKSKKDARNLIFSHIAYTSVNLSSKILAFLSNHITQKRAKTAQRPNTFAFLFRPKNRKSIETIKLHASGATQVRPPQAKNCCHKLLDTEQCKKRWFRLYPSPLHIMHQWGERKQLRLLFWRISLVKMLPWIKDHIKNFTLICAKDFQILSWWGKKWYVWFFSDFSKEGFIRKNNGRI